MEPELIEKNSLVSLPAYQQRFSRCAEVGPALDERIEVFLRIDPHHQDAESCTFRDWVQDRNEDAQIYFSCELVAIKVGERYPPRAEGFDRLLAHMARQWFGRGLRKRQPA